MLVAAEPIGKEVGHVLGDGLCVVGLLEFEDGVHALAEFRIGQTDHNAERTLG